MRIYKINLNYIKYLHNADSKVQYNRNYTDSKNQNRPYIGPVLKKDGLFYYAPLEHPRPEHEKLKDSNHIEKIVGGRYGLIGINNMIPVPKDQLIDFDIRADNNSKVLISQLVFCRKHLDEIKSKARKIYYAQTNPNTAKLQHSCCNFKLLESKCWKYKLQPQDMSLEQNNSNTQSADNTLQQKVMLPNEISGVGFIQT